MTNETMAFNVQVFVEPALHEIEKTSLRVLEWNGTKIEFKEHLNNKTELIVLLNSKRDELKNKINDLLGYFLGRFELESKSFRSYSHTLGQITNLKTGKRETCIKVTVFKPIDSIDEQYVRPIDNLVKSSENTKIIKYIAFFHLAKRAKCPQHAFLSISNAFNDLINDIGRQGRTRCSGAMAVERLFHEKIIKDEKSKKEWEKKILEIHNTIDKIRYENLSVSKKVVDDAIEQYKEFMDMYIKYVSTAR